MTHCICDVLELPGGEEVQVHVHAFPRRKPATSANRAAHVAMESETHGPVPGCGCNRSASIRLPDCWWNAFVVSESLVMSEWNCLKEGRSHLRSSSQCR